MDEFIDFMKQLQNPPNSVSAAYLDDPVFGNTFDGVDIAAKPEGMKQVIQSVLNLFLEFEDVRQGSEAEYDILGQFFAALLKYAVHVDDSLDTEEQIIVVGTSCTHLSSGTSSGTHYGIPNVYKWDGRSMDIWSYRSGCAWKY